MSKKIEEKVRFFSYFLKKKKKEGKKFGKSGKKQYLCTR